MSIIVAIRKNGKTVLAADSQQSFGIMKPAPGNLAESKLMKTREGWIGSTSWGLYENILNDHLKSKKKFSFRDKQGVFEFFLGLWRRLHDKYTMVNDQCQEKESPFGDMDASFLVVNRRGQFFHVARDMSVVEFLRFHAIGSGCDFAIGALDALYAERLSARQIAERAVGTAITHNIYCGGKIEVVEI